MSNFAGLWLSTSRTGDGSQNCDKSVFSMVFEDGRYMKNVYDVLAERGFIKQCTNDTQLKNVLSNDKIKFYCGFDPTGPSLHIGHLVPVFAMAHLAKAGHFPIALIGGGTARIPDPTGKSEMRKILSVAEIAENASSISEQLVRFLSNCGITAGNLTVVNNADWLNSLNYIDFLRDIGIHFSVNRMLSFETYKMRMERGLSFIEFNYQLLQSYDFHILNRDLNCTLQIGGDDQWGNIVSGTDLIRRINGEGTSGEVFGLTFPLVTRSDGKKMGKTEKGSLFLDRNMTPAFEIYQYWRNIPDADVGKFMKIFTFIPIEEIHAFEKLEGAEANKAKERLAYDFVSLIHGTSIADECVQTAQAAFGAKSSDLSSMPTLEISAAALSSGCSIMDLLVETGLVPSKNEARRLIAQGAVNIGNAKVMEISLKLDTELWQSEKESDGSVIIRAGKKKFHRIVVK